MFSAFGLYVVVLINGDRYESVPAVFDTEQECLNYERTVTEQYYETACFKGLFKEEKNK